jgi:broad specificity phosphatase PhoE
VIWFIPPSVLHWLPEMPADRSVALLLRHSVRPPFEPGDDGYALPLTMEGVALARDLGERLGSRLSTLHTSPLLRCVQTAAALRDGAGVACEIVSDHALGDPGVYVLDDRLAQHTWLELGHEAVMAHLVSGEGMLSGLADPDDAARRLICHLLAPGRSAGLHVFVTHDSLVTATVARTLGRRLGKGDWPLYLEAAFFWREASGVGVAYRDHREVSP